MNASNTFDNPALTGIVSTARAVNKPSMLSRVSALRVALHIILAASVSHTTTTGKKIIAINSCAPVICVLFDCDGSFNVVR